MRIVCAWCGKDIEEKPPLDNPEVTHGICKDCLRQNFPHVAELVERIDRREEDESKRGPRTV